MADDQPAETEPTEEDEEKKDPMGWIGLGVHVGVASIGSSKLTLQNPTYRRDAAMAAALDPRVEQEFRNMFGDCAPIDKNCTTTADSRSGLQLTLAITMGGDGFGWSFDPYLNFAEDARAYGGYTGPKFDIHILDPLYVGFGFGLKGAWVKAKGYDYAGDLYGRVPIRVTWYAITDLAVVAEFGIGYGASFYYADAYTDMTTGEEIDSEISAGTSMTWDLSLGFRLP